ncbi:DUF4365 domain-containing protein [Streptomyces sp. WI04-05B]|uniref:DUF4365 domain-containing protein n=1 Tax=Streptomyces TaxID=1883 RepID=UPI0029A80B56|nr:MULTISPECIES: DUF4365 domain-containing protein [unclassified Streptomyces]MDX2548271.1 DUF4365 domain-containing protein [Streptomyces sp. WI04-05B]MDX2586647.1 DUF4365 domain-containing protein [Streptomyces sp. WI04-05A]MDX3746255.1 DUF4365 domain-containing protein [Streptomyces sp. AK08-02]
MRRKPSAKVANIGVTRTKLAVEDELKWLFREQPTEDYGIDVHAEVVDGEDVRGRLLALQIKSGKSWFRESAPEGWWFRPDGAHVDYWLNHSLPVAVVLYHPETKRCHWQLVNRQTLQETPTGGWKLLVPEAQMLDASARKTLREAAEGDPYELRIRELQLAKPWMELLASGKRLVVDMAEWVNKSSGRGDIRLGIDNEDGEEPEKLASWGVFLGLASYAEVVPKLFAWADALVHPETYDGTEYDQYRADCCIWDDEYEVFAAVPFTEWKLSLDTERIRPYRNGGGEVDFYRLELTLNELGKAFLVVDRFGMEGGRLLTKVDDPGS